MREIKLLWCADPIGILERKMPGHTMRPPEVLFTGAPADDVEAWLERNSWARSLPLFSWHPVDGPAWANRQGLLSLARTSHSSIHTRAFQGPGDGFWNVTGPLPREASVRWWAGGSRPNAVCAAAFDVALALGGPVVWEVGAQATGGLLALGAAIVEGRAVAVDQGDPGPLILAAATRHNCMLRVVA